MSDGSTEKNGDRRLQFPTPRWPVTKLSRQILPFQCPIGLSSHSDPVPFGVLAWILLHREVMAGAQPAFSSPIKTKGGAVMKPTCASGFRSPWSILLSHQGFTHCDQVSTGWT